MSASKRVAVIGSGGSGVAAIKCCVDEGLEPVCFERTDGLGGLWKYTQEVVEGQACVMQSTIMNTSKEMTCYSDFPVPKEFPNYMPHAMVLEYFQQYAKHFQLEQYIRYNMEVKMVRPAADFQSTGRWTLQLVDHKSGDSSTEVFDAVLVCTGHHADKNEPSFPGLADFQGQVLHSHDYREPTGYEGKRVLVIGAANSGGDVAVELSRSGQVYLSTRRGEWIVQRRGPKGMPLDMIMSRRISSLINGFLPHAVCKWKMAKEIDSCLDHDLYRLRAEHPPFAQHPTVNDDLGSRIICGSVKIKTDVKRFTATGVEFVDGSFEDNIDVVVMATGYKFGFPFIDKSVVDVKENRLPFFKNMFPPDLQHHTLAIIGCFQPNGGVTPVSEMQCRLATRVFKGEVKLPSSSKMWDDILARETSRAKFLTKSLRHTIEVSWIGFMDELAELNGCKPDLVSLLIKDPRLALKVLFGPCTPYQYRLIGPGKWSGARDAIMTTMDRVRYPLSTRPLLSSAGCAFPVSYILWVVALMVLLFVLRAIFV